MVEPETLWPEVTRLLPDEKVVAAAIALSEQCLKTGIASAAELEAAERLLVDISRTQRTIAKDNTDNRRVIEDQKKLMSAEFSRALTPLQAAVEHIEKIRANWNRQEWERVEKERKVAIEAAAKEKRRLEALADRAEARGDEDRAINYAERAATTRPAPVEAPTPAAQKTGVYDRTLWKWEVVALELLPDHLLLMSPDTEAIDAIVQSQKAATKIPGIRAYATTSTVAKG